MTEKDIEIDRLRQWPLNCYPACGEAADEIDRLEERIEELEQEVTWLQSAITTFLGELRSVDPDLLGPGR